MVAVINMKRGESLSSPRAGGSAHSAGSGVGGWAQSWRLSFGGRDAPSADAAAEDNTGGGVLEDLEGMFQMSYTERLYSFIGCAAFGVVLFLFAYLFISVVNVRAFVICLSFGTISMLLSTVFLMGPAQQLKRMLHPTRLVAFGILVCSLILSIFSGFKHKTVAACIFGCIEILAFLWYALSFIPYARTFFLKLIGM